MTPSKKIARVFFAAVLAASMMSGCGEESSSGATPGNEPDRTYTLKRGPMTLGVTVAGFVNARKKYFMAMEASTDTKLLWIADENTEVKEGDLLARFDKKDLENRIEELKVEVDNFEQELIVQGERKKIQDASGEESLKTAFDRLETAEDNMRKYRRYELRQQRSSFTQKVQDAEVALAQAKSTYAEYKDSISTASASDAAEKAKQEQQLLTYEKAITTAERNLDNAMSNQKVFNRYDHPAKMKSLQSAIDQAQLNRDKTVVQVKSEAVQLNRQIANTNRRLRFAKDNLEQNESYLPLMELYAPIDGIVLYGNADDRWSRTEMKLGMNIAKGMILMTIPDQRALIVELNLPELYRSQVEVGNTVIVTPDSLQGVKLRGRIDSIAVVPHNEVYWNPDSPKVYKTVIEVDDPEKQLVTGISVQLEVVTGQIENALFVPIESVFERGEEFFVYKKNGSAPVETVVGIGRSNDAFVEISSGLNEGDVIFLYRPFQKSESRK